MLGRSRDMYFQCVSNTCVTFYTFRNVVDTYKHIICDEEKNRLQSIERLDEIEEWEMLMSHYCLLLGVKCDTEDLTNLLQLMP